MTFADASFAPHSATRTDLAARPSVGARIRALLVEMNRRAVARQQCRHLLECEDYVLQDIGVTRSDVRHAMRSHTPL